MDAWLKEAKTDKNSAQCGMYLFHNGIVRQTAKAKVRLNEEGMAPVTGMCFSYDTEKVKAAITAAQRMPGIFHGCRWRFPGPLQYPPDAPPPKTVDFRCRRWYRRSQ